jgi:hypothetical protein
MTCLFTVGQKVEKFGGDYGGPGVVVGGFELVQGIWRYNVAHMIQGGYGVFIHIYNEREIRLIQQSCSPE